MPRPGEYHHSDKGRSGIDLRCEKSCKIHGVNSLCGAPRFCGIPWSVDTAGLTVDSRLERWALWGRKRPGRSAPARAERAMFCTLQPPQRVHQQLAAGVG